MQQYRLYCLDGVGGISLAEWLEASDDADAIQQARELKRGALKCEVWLGKRLVATLDGQRSSRLNPGQDNAGDISQPAPSRHRT